VPKQKTHKGLAKRVKISGRGKVMHHRSGAAHLLSKKGSRRRRRLRQPAGLAKGEAKNVRQQLGR